LRPRLVFLADAAGDFRNSVRRARARKRFRVERTSADEVKRRLDETRARLRSEIPPRSD